MDRSPVIPGIMAVVMVIGAALFLAVLWNDALVGATRVAAYGGDLKSLSAEPSCSGRVWPYYSTECLRDLRQPDGRARPVRILASESSDRHIVDIR